MNDRQLLNALSRVVADGFYIRTGIQKGCRCCGCWEYQLVDYNDEPVIREEEWDKFCESVHALLKVPS